MTILFYCMVDDDGIITSAYYNESAIPKQQYDYFIYNMDPDVIVDIENGAKYKVSKPARDIMIEKIKDAPAPVEQPPEEEAQTNTE